MSDYTYCDDCLRRIHDDADHSPLICALMQCGIEEPEEFLDEQGWQRKPRPKYRKGDRVRCWMEHRVGDLVAIAEGAEFTVASDYYPSTLGTVHVVDDEGHEGNVFDRFKLV